VFGVNASTMCMPQSISASQRTLISAVTSHAEDASPGKKPGGSNSTVKLTWAISAAPVIGALDAAVGPVKVRDRGFSGGELLTGIAAAQLAGEDFLVGLDRQRADAAGQRITPVPGLASTAATGLARRVTPAQWKKVETGLAAVTGRMLGLLSPQRAAALTGGPVTIDLDTTDVEVYGAKKRGVAYNHQGQRVGRPHVATWAETEIVLAAGLGPGTDDPRAGASALLRRALAALPKRARQSGRVALRADAGYFAGQLARAAHDEHIYGPIRQRQPPAQGGSVLRLGPRHLLRDKKAV
jgi:DDE family transposase